MSDTFSQIIEKLDAARPTLYFTPDEDGGGDRHVRYGFYEIKDCSLGPVMLHFTEEVWHGGILHANVLISNIAVRVKKSNFEDSASEVSRNDFHIGITFLQNARREARIEKNEVSPADAVKGWNNFLQKPNGASKLDVRPKISALKSFDATLAVLDLHRPFELFDWNITDKGR